MSFNCLYMIKDKILVIKIAFTDIFKMRINYFYFVIILFSFLGFYYFLPAFIVPGNDIFYQISLLSIYDHLSVITLSILISYLIVMHLHAYKIRKRYTSLYHKSREYSSILTSFAAGMLSSFGCISCFLSTLTFFPTAAFLFLYSYKIYVYLFSLLLLLISIYYTSLKVLGKCNRC